MMSKLGQFSSLNFGTPQESTTHLLVRHGKQDSSEDEMLFEVVYEKIKIVPKFISDETASPKIVKALNSEKSENNLTRHRKEQRIKFIRKKSKRNCYQCKICLQPFPLIRYFRKHLIFPSVGEPNICQEYYKVTNPDNIWDADWYIARSQSQEKINSTSTNSKKPRIELLPRKQLPNESIQKEIWLISDDEIELIQFEPNKQQVEQTGGKNAEIASDACIQNKQDSSLSDDKRKYSIHDPNSFVEASTRNSKSNFPNKEVAIQGGLASECEICLSKFANMERLRKHKLLAHGRICHKCPICKLEFPDSINLKRHKLIVHTEKDVGQNVPKQYRGHGGWKQAKQQSISTHVVSFTCNICQAQFQDLPHFKQHKITVHPQPQFARFDNSPKKLISVTNSERGELPVPERKRHKCDSCVKEYSKFRDFKEHKSAVHDNLRYTCNLCQKQFKNSRNFKEHKLVAHGDFSNTCNLCHKRFTDLGLKLHKLRAHRESCHTCDSCPKSFGFIASLKEHRSKVHGGIRYNCNSCEIEFSDLENLKQHTLSVHQGYRYQCEVCQKFYSSMSNLNQHKAFVHGETRYPCDACQATFARSADVKRHKLAVHDRVCYTCDICNRNFCTQPYLRKHKLAVHDGVVEKCEMCPKTFKTRNGLKKHKFTVHSIVQI